MGKIKKILENELVGGTQTVDVYPVTSVKAVYDENNERLDHILNRRGIVNISTNYNSDHIAEVLTLSQAIAKVPASDRVLGFQGNILTADGWVTYKFIGTNIAQWSNTEYWANIVDSSLLAHELGDNGNVVISQKGVTEIIEGTNTSVGINDYPKFSETKSYKKGAIVRYDNHLYLLRENHEAGAWSPSIAQPISIKEMSSFSLNTKNRYKVSSKGEVTLQRILSPLKKGDVLHINVISATVNSKDDENGCLAVSIFNNDPEVTTGSIFEVVPIYDGTTNKYSSYVVTQDYDFFNIIIATNSHVSDYEIEFEVFYSMSSNLARLENYSSNRFVNFEGSTSPTITYNEDDDNLLLHWDVLFLVDSYYVHYNRRTDVNLTVPNSKVLVYSEMTDLNTLYFTSYIGVEADNDANYSSYRSYKKITNPSNVIPICVISNKEVKRNFIDINDYKREVKDTLMPFYNLNKWHLGSWYSLGKGKDSSCEYYNKFKKGDTIFVNIKNVIIDGTPVVDKMFSIVVYGIVDGKSSLLTQIFYGASTEKDYIEYTFNQDVDGIRVDSGGNASVTFTDYGADVMVARNIDEISADIDEISADIDFRSITNYLSFPANYSLGDNIIPRFISKSESNVKIANGAIKINNVDGGGSLDFRISIEENIENYSNKRVWFSIESYSTQERNYTLYKNSSLIANFKSPAGYDFTPHKVKLPSFSEGDYIYISVSNTFEDAEIGCIYLSDKHPNFEIPRLQSLDYYDDKYKGIAQNGIYSGVNIYANSGDKAVSSSPSIIGYRTPLSQDKNVIIDSIVLYQNSFNQGQEFDIYVGIEDQRGWFIERTRYKAKSVKQICGRTLIIPEDVAIVNAGEIVFINTGSSLWRFSTYNIDEDNLLLHISVGSNQETIIRERPDVNLFTYIINIRNAAINDIYAKKGDLDTLETTVSNVQSQLAGIDVYTDVSTGDKYRILINNGQIYLKSLNYKKVLILGNSFTNHGVNDYWYTQRGMASSISKVDYKHLLQTALGEDAEVTNIGNAGFETGYNTSFDFSTIPFPEEEFDAVIVQLGENSSYRDDMQECWTNFLNYIKQKYPTADVVQVIGWSTGSKLQAISRACSAAGITMLNCYDETFTGQFTEGDYVTAGVSETDYNIIKPMVKTHPSDVGMLLIANRILSYWDMEELDMFRDITLQQNTGGTISVPYEQWVVGGLVSVKCDADSGYSIQSLSVNNGDITVTQRTNEYGIYYTFFMPDENVTIVPTWAQS